MVQLKLDDIGLHTAEIFKLYGHPRTYSKGEIVFQKGAPSDEIYFIVEGRVRAFCLDQDGDEITLFYVDENNLVGKEGIIKSPIRFTNVDAVTVVRLYSMDIEVLLKTCSKNNVSMLDLMSLCVRNIAILSDYICCNHFLRNVEKVAYFLYSNCISERNVIEYTHEQIASATGMNRVSVTRLLKSFEKNKLISLRYKEIKILNKNGLAEIFNSTGYS